jgi:hypothetical protein
MIVISKSFLKLLAASCTEVQLIRLWEAKRTATVI